MDPCFIDIAVEFLSVVFHNILYYSSIYPETIFETRRKYNVVVHRLIHPELNDYLDRCLKSIEEYLKNDSLHRVDFNVTNEKFEPMITFVFEFMKNLNYDDTTDAYLVQVEENLRAFCLHLSSLSRKLPAIPGDCGFSVNLHTNQSAAVAMASNTTFEDFPYVEVAEKNDSTRKIFPLRRFPVRTYNFDVYVEMKTLEDL